MRSRTSSNLLGLVASIIAPSFALAGVEAETMIRQYDDSRTKVTSPAIDVTGTFNRDTMKVGFGWALDILTSASADVETFASKGSVADRRVEYNTSFESQIPDGTISVGYIQSDENDYHSKTVSAGGTREFFQKNTVVSVGFANGDDNIRSSSDSTFDKKMLNQSYSISLTQVLSKVSILQLLYDFRVENGYIASPYRRAKFVDPSTGAISGQPENHPLTRNRNAIALKYNYFFDGLAVSSATTYRLYQDSWGVLSHTVEQRLTKELGKEWSASLSFRYYTQQQAKFYEDYYHASLTSPPPFYTGNNTLASYDGYMIGLRPVWQINDNLKLVTKFEYYKQNFKNASDAHKLGTLSDDTKLDISASVIGLGLDAKF